MLRSCPSLKGWKRSFDRPVVHCLAVCKNHALCADPSDAQQNSLTESRRCQRLPDDALEPVLVPLDSLLLVDFVGCADAGLAASALGNALAGTGPEKHTLSVHGRSFRT